MVNRFMTIISEEVAYQTPVVKRKSGERVIHLTWTASGHRWLIPGKHRTLRILATKCLSRKPVWALRSVLTPRRDWPIKRSR
ncbi:uncharacterized protein DMAD_04336 [Drosophila madeirensis]|uniref:Uncharacterized protein n=1 Tax=Drosophila madeirensis TaxID=30013 RepID=A0AAU9GDT7_DROMD